MRATNPCHGHIAPFAGTLPRSSFHLLLLPHTREDGTSNQGRNFLPWRQKHRKTCGFRKHNKRLTVGAKAAAEPARARTAVALASIVCSGDVVSLSDGSLKFMGRLAAGKVNFKSSQRKILGVTISNWRPSQPRALKCKTRHNFVALVTQALSSKSQSPHLNRVSRHCARF
jgi:hypothetical protein